MNWRVLLISLCVTLSGATLADLQATAARLRAQQRNPPNWRGESPLLTGFKHELRDWVESQMSGEIEDPAAFGARLNQALKEARLVCLGSLCSAGNANLGYVGELELSSFKGSPGWMMVVTSVGIVCECDQSVYLYEWQGGEWRRRLESEQNGYGQGRYKPQWASGYLSIADAQGERLFLTVGSSAACASVWQQGYFRLFRIGARIGQILDQEQDSLNIGQDVNQRVGPHDVLIEFGSMGTEPGFYRRRVLHFRVDGDQVKRISPIALRPAEFIDEWLSLKWSIVGDLSDPRLSRLHAVLHGAGGEAFVFGQACASRTGVSQIAADFDKLGRFYFLVRDDGEHRYRMLDVSSQRQSGCPGERELEWDSDATLFPAAKSQ